MTQTGCCVNAKHLNPELGTFMGTANVKIYNKKKLFYVFIFGFEWINKQGIKK